MNGVIDITEGPAMRSGVTYEVADGTEIPNLGERKFLGFIEEGGQRCVTAQICAVEKTLMPGARRAAQAWARFAMPAGHRPGGAPMH